MTLYKLPKEIAQHSRRYPVQDARRVSQRSKALRVVRNSSTTPLHCGPVAGHPFVVLFVHLLHAKAVVMVQEQLFLCDHHVTRLEEGGHPLVLALSASKSFFFFMDFGPPDPKKPLKISFFFQRSAKKNQGLQFFGFFVFIGREEATKQKNLRSVNH